jgi:hypothetical protein
MQKWKKMYAQQNPFDTTEFISFTLSHRCRHQVVKLPLRKRYDLPV